MDPFKLDPASIRILSEVFDHSLREGVFVNATEFRVAHKDQRPLIDRLEERRFLQREGQGKLQYRVTLPALMAIDSKDSNMEIGRCADIFGCLQKHYENPDTRPKNKLLSELVSETKLPDHQVWEAVTYLLDSQSLWLAGAHLDPIHKSTAYVNPNERILDFQSFDDVLHQVAEWHIPRPYVPVPNPALGAPLSPDLQEKTQRLLALLERIQAGERSFQPSSQSSSDIASFQIVARELDHLNRQGFLQSFQALRDSQSGRSQFVAIEVGDLTYEGSLNVQQLRSALSRPANEPGQGKEQPQQDSMLVFISWSGELSHRIALALREWLPVALPGIEPWVSSEDIAKGTRWTPEMADALAKAYFGVICVVPDNCREPWISFEAGAISNQLDARVSPFLFGITPSELGKNPLTQFQCTSYEKNDIRKLLHSINEANPTAHLLSDRLDRTFEICWHGLQEKLDPLATPKDGKSKPKTRSNSTVAKEQIAPQPDMCLEDVVKRITGKQTLLGSNEAGSDEVLRACETLRERALLGHINVFGGIGWRTTKPAEYDRMVRGPIPPEYWRTHRIDVIAFLGDGDRRGTTTDLSGHQAPDDHYGIWFDKNQIDALWPI